MSNMVGTGPLSPCRPFYATMGGPQPGVLVRGALLAIADGLVFAELGTTFPSSGGSYTYLRECFGREGLGRLMAWLFVWQFLFSATLEIATALWAWRSIRVSFQGLVSRPGFTLPRCRVRPSRHDPALSQDSRYCAHHAVLWSGLLLTSVGRRGSMVHLNRAVCFDFLRAPFT